ncbi:MAG: protein kinase rio1 [Phylliscum demangeonii]|nr:MAG: protein kinase rio1 [Phylliscum demangeonii]
MQTYASSIAVQNLEAPETEWLSSLYLEGVTGVADLGSREAFRQQYISQTLEQVYDVDRDAKKVGRGEGGDPELFAEKVVLPDRMGSSEMDGRMDDPEGSDTDDDGFVDDEHKAPRVKRFEDQDTKKVATHIHRTRLGSSHALTRLQEHKKQVKEIS